MIKALIIDDEKNNTDNLSILLSKYCNTITSVEVAHSSAAGRAAVASQTPDLVFLDIQMPGENGFDFLQSLPDIQFEVIFVTAHDKYGMQAARFSAIDYLLKPVVIPELVDAVQKASKRIEQKKENINLKNLLQYLKNKNPEEQKLALPLMSEIKFVPIKHIIRAESNNVYTYFFLEKEERVLVSKPIKYYEEILTEYGFIRTHQSHLINKAHVKSMITKDGLSLLMSDDVQVPVARQRKEEVRNSLLPS